MEVHHHSHTPRKKWTHYFWEFLMLFLAVFCGFWAENQREHYIEAQRAKEYAKGLYNDIKSDTADIHKGIRHITYYLSVIDSIISIASPFTGNTKLPGSFYYYSRLATNTYPIDWNRSTLNQLIQSGNLRYFSNKELVEKINRYYALQGNIDGSSETDNLQREAIRALRNKILANTYFSVFALNVLVDDAVDKKPVVPQADTLMRLMLPLQKGAEQYLNEYLNHLNERAIRFSGYTKSYFTRASELAEDILKMLKKEYLL